jgi:D-ribitol-5-phosphate cytidylyltransferase
MIFGAILAGGLGKRMGSAGTPKQFLDLAGKPIIIHTIEKFLLCRKIDVLFVAVPYDWLLYSRDVIDKYIPDHEKEICILEGGSTRNETIMNVISRIKENYKITDNDIIVTHDAVRPFVPARVIDENILAVIETGACDTVIPATDTIIQSKDGAYIIDIPERKSLYQGQTPQSFKINLISNAYLNIPEEERNKLTDACGILVFRGIPVKLVLGSILNIKITTQDDLLFAESLVK